MKNTVIFIVAVVVAITVLLFLGKSATNKAKADDGKVTVGFHEGNAAPDFDLPVIDGKGKKMKLSELKGKTVVVDFWATWCDPCKIEIPWLVDLQKKYAAQGLQIVGVAEDDSSEEEISAFTKKMGINYPTLKGTEGVADNYGGLQGLPTTFFLDRSGKVVVREVGLKGQDELERNIKAALQQGKAN